MGERSVTTLELIVSGANAFGYGAASVFFLRFWVRSHDQLFLAFSASFALLGFNQILVASFGSESDYSAPFYVLRLIAFGIIIAAIVGKNVKPS
jgi:hypothetical protein